MTSGSDFNFRIDGFRYPQFRTITGQVDARLLTNQTTPEHLQMNTHQKARGRLASAALLRAACTPNLDVTNPNKPDIARALASPEDVQSLADLVGELLVHREHGLRSRTRSSPTTADVLTANFGNFGMRFNNLEPRIAVREQLGGW